MQKVKTIEMAMKQVSIEGKNQILDESPIKKSKFDLNI